MMQKVELLAPAGDLEKLKIAILYGADAVFIGGKKFSLRAKASNFSLEDIKEGCDFAHKYNKKIHVTVNIYPHEKDLDGLKEYLIELDKCGVDAIIVSSLYIMKVALSLNLRFEVHVSTQLSSNNTKTIEFFKELGVHRVVLGRECTIDEIKEIKNKSPLDIEVFIHGGLCSSYSGRCTLSNNLCNRDANRGGCAHSCRWFYDLYLDNEKINTDEEKFRIGSKDLCGVNQLLSLLEIGVDSLKIEGRMKSLHYIATVVSNYRKLIDAFYANELTIELINEVEKEIRKVENRPLTEGYLKGYIDENDIIYDQDDKTSLQDFLGIVLDYDKETKLAKVYRKNYFKVDEQAEIFKYDGNNTPFIIKEIYDLEMNPIEIANRSDEILYIRIDEEIKKDYMIRRIKNENN